jgi:hypothetical protein
MARRSKYSMPASAAFRAARPCNPRPTVRRGECINMMHSTPLIRNQIFTRAAATSLTLTRQKTMRCITGANHALRLLRDRKKRCSHRLQRKGTMPIQRNIMSSSRRCDLRMLRSRHFGHETAIAGNLLKILRPGEVGVPMAASAAFRAARCCNAQCVRAAVGYR